MSKATEPDIAAAPIREQRLLRRQCYIDGVWCDAVSGERMTVTNPSTRTVLAEVPRMGAVETRRAIDAAERALPAWRALPAHQRSAILERWGTLLLRHRDDLARLMTLEQGKPFAESVGEIGYAASFIEWFAEEAKRAYGRTIPAKSADRRILVLKEPVGLCAAITPWNFPAAMVTRKAAPALAAGCTMILKPAPQTPLSALALAELAHEAGVPPGVFSVITGEAQEIGAVLTTDPRVRKLTFTGSTEVGRLLMRECAGTVKKISLELGGNAPFIVFDDADLDAAVEGLMASKFRNTGQTCVCANRIFVQGGCHDAFVAKLQRAVSVLKVGDGFAEGVTQGPLIDDDAIAKVEMLLDDARALGGRIVQGGRRHALGGTFFEPTILADASTRMRLAQEEIFGPVAPLFRFEREADAIALANATEYGLAGYFYTRDLGRAWRVAEKLECGIVGINTGLVSTEVAPFGGMKQSGLGREGSVYGLDEYMELKCVCVAGLHGTEDVS